MSASICWWLGGWRRWYLERVDLLQREAQNSTVLQWYQVGGIFLRCHWGYVGCGYKVYCYLHWFRTWWEVAYLHCWGVGFWRWVWLWAVCAHKYASIVGDAKVCVGVTAWSQLLVAGCLDASGHRVVEFHCIQVRCSIYSSYYQGLGLCWEPDDGAVFLVMEVPLRRRLVTRVMHLV